MKRLLTLTLIAWLISCQAVWAAITIDAVASGVGTTSTTYNHTIAADANLIVICPAQRDGANAVQPVASVTVGGEAATFLTNAGVGTLLVRAEIWYKLAPLTGVQSIVATGGSGTDQMTTGSISFKSAAQTSTFNTPATAGPTTGTNADVDSIASAVGELAVMCIAKQTNPTCAADATSPVSVEKWDVAQGGNQSACGYTEDGAATSINMRVDLSASVNWAAAAVSIRPLVTTTRRPQAPIIFQ